MNAPPASHPIDQVLQAFGLGKLDQASAESVSAHLVGCTDCRRRIAELSSDSSRGRLPGATPGPESLGPAVSSAYGLSMSGAAPATAAPPPAGSLPPGLADHSDYQVVRELGRGGMGVVYLAQNVLMGRMEVLKVVSGHLIDRPAVRERFLREIRSAARLQHPNIVTAYSAKQLGESLVLAMEYVEGIDLSRVVKAKGPMPVANACYYTQQAAIGLQHAHEHAMVHRDIKPANLILARASARGNKATVKVLDFGLAKVTSEGQADSGLTREGQMLGTPDYIAPEQIRNAQSADIRADIYSLGCTLYYLLTGTPPFTGDNLWDLYQAHFSMDASPLNLVRAEIPAELAALVAKMMAKDPERRFQEPKEVAQALAPFVKKGDVVVRASSEQASPVGQATADRAEPQRRAAAPPSQSAPSLAPVLPRPVTGPAETARAVPEWKSLIGSEGAEHPPGSAAAVMGPWRRRPPWVWPAIVAASVLGALTLGIIIYVATDYGRVKIVIDDPGAVVRIDDEEILIKTPRESIDLRVGKHELTVTWRDGRFSTREFVIHRGEDEDLRVEFEPTAGDRPGTKQFATPSTTTALRDTGKTRAKAPAVKPPGPPPARGSDPRSSPEPIVKTEEPVPGTVEVPGQVVTSLFNGRDMTGWTAFLNSRKVEHSGLARVDRGEIVLVPPGGVSGLRTNRIHRNFTLKLEYLFPVGGTLTNPGSGVIILPGSRGGLNYQQGIEFQIRPGETGDLWAFVGASLVGQEQRGQLGKVARKLDAENPPGQWNAVVIRCEGPRIAYELNGREVNRAEGRRPIAGFIGLMNQGSEIRFRNIEIHEPPPRPGTPAGPPAIARRASPVVGRWRHGAGAPNANRGGIINLAADGSILNAQGVVTGTWSLSGSTLSLRWPNKQAPGGAWIDTVMLTPNRQRYQGRNQRGVVIRGVRVGD